MQPTRILHLADLHLGDPHEYLGPAASPRREEADGLLRRLVDHALRPEERIGGVLIAGDLFDHYDPPATLVDATLAELKRLVAGGVRLLTVPGNHDEYSYPRCVYRTRAADWPGTLVQSPSPTPADRWELGGVAVDLYAMAYIAGRSREPYDRFEVHPGSARKIAVLHGSLDAPWSDRSVPLRSENLGELGLDYVALGHIHKPTDKRLRQGWACYPGRIEGGGFGDAGGAELVRIDLAQESLRPERVPFASRPISVVTWNASGLANEEELSARLRELADPRAIVRLVLNGLPGFELDGEAVARRFADRFFHLEVEASEALPPGLLDRLAEERTARGSFVRIARAQIASASGEAERGVREAALRYGLAAFSADEVAASSTSDSGGER